MFLFSMRIILSWLFLTKQKIQLIFIFASPLSI